MPGDSRSEERGGAAQDHGPHGRGGAALRALDRDAGQRPRRLRLLAEPAEDPAEGHQGAQDVLGQVPSSGQQTTETGSTPP